MRKSPDGFEAWVRAPAREGRANREALEALASALGVDARRLRLIKGASSPSKIVQVYGVPEHAPRP